MATLQQIESQIAALETRHAELDAKSVKPSTGHPIFDSDVMDAMSVVGKQLQGLRQRRSSVLAGRPDPVEAPATSSMPSTSPPLRPPRWITTKENRTSAAVVHEQNAATAISLPLETALDDLFSLYGTEAYLAIIEDAVRERSAKIVENGRACEFDEKMYTAIVAMFWRISATSTANFHWERNQRKLLEQRVSALESSERHFSSGEMQRMTAYLAPQFDTAPLPKRIDQLEQHQMQLEQQRSAMRYRGVWAADEQYELGNFCTDHGSLWHCNQTTRDRPGDGRAWTLAVKKGQDAEMERSNKWRDIQN